MLLNAEWPAKCHSPPSHPFLPWHPICCGAPVWPGVLSTHLYITSSHPVPLQSHLHVPIWMVLEKAHKPQDHDSQAQTNTDLVFRSAGTHLVYYTCEHCKVSEWQIISGWKSKRAFLLHISAEPPALGDPSPRHVVCCVPPPQLKHRTDCPSLCVSTVMEEPENAEKISLRPTPKLLLWAVPFPVECT